MFWFIDENSGSSLETLGWEAGVLSHVCPAGQFPNTGICGNPLYTPPHRLPGDAGLRRWGEGHGAGREEATGSTRVMGSSSGPWQGLRWASWAPRCADGGGGAQPGLALRAKALDVQEREGTGDLSTASVGGEPPGRSQGVRPLTMRRVQRGNQP